MLAYYRWLKTRWKQSKMIKDITSVAKQCGEGLKVNGPSKVS